MFETAKLVSGVLEQSLQKLSKITTEKRSKMLSCLVISAFFWSSSATKLAYRHSANVCMMRGECGSESFFGPQLPCLYNEEALEPDTRLRQSLLDICGPRFGAGPVCCDLAQLTSLAENLKKAENLIASCPACKANFFDFFCTFTCSPDQSLFLNVEETKEISPGKTVVSRLSHYVSASSAVGFFDSCKSIKFSATNGYVMDLIGGGAKNSTSFLRFLGHKSLLGSPIQIDYPSNVPKEFVPSDEKTRACNDADLAYRCACIDCPDACPALLPVQDPSATCHVGMLPCFSFSVMIIYLAALLAFVLGYLLHLKTIHKLQRRASRLRLVVSGATSLENDAEEDQATLGPEQESDNTYLPNTLLQQSFTKLGFSCARYPYATIGAGIIFVLLLSIGWVRFELETNPVKLWVSPVSSAAQEKDFFDSTFGPFYRAQQIFLVNDSVSDATVLTYDNLAWWFNLEKRITQLEISGINLAQVCFNPTGTGCVIQSVTGYWQGDLSNVDEMHWQEDLVSCANQPVNCLPLFQQPLKPNMIFGGHSQDISKSKALISSIVLRNSLDAEEIRNASVWEGQLKSLLLEAQLEAAVLGLRLSFSTEISLEQELSKSSNTDARIVILSYLVMFLYTSIALSGLLNKKAFSLASTKVSLGLFGIVIVLMSVSAAVGLFSVFAVKATLIIAEVIPFLILAVGVDNIFLLNHEFDKTSARYNEKTVEERVAMTMGQVGPSILLSALSETVAFGLGAAVGMPAVRNFAIYASGAVFINGILQLTIFPAAMALDQLRRESNRVDCLPCLRISSTPAVELGFEEPISKFIRVTYAPWLIRPYVKTAILFVFLSLTAWSMALFPHIELGLDQKLAIPQDSYLVKYFEDLEKFFNMGPPVYFVIKASNATQRSIQQAMCGKFTTCEEYSLANILEQERKRPEISYVLEPAASWIDDFFYWLNPQFELCCRVRKDDPEIFCSANEPEGRCQPCFKDRNPMWNVSLSGMPQGREFIYYLQEWLLSPVSEDCPLAGEASYSSAIRIDQPATSLVASHVRSFHVPLRTQEDLINSYAAAKRISSDISKVSGLEVYPYAVHYIYFDQYATIRTLTFKVIASALTAVFLLATILLGSVVASVLMTLSVAMIVVNIAGVMAIWDISLNALSLVNLVISLGIGVEFCAHFTRAYVIPSTRFIGSQNNMKHNREQRVCNALVTTGSSTFTGITMCKFVGILVLAFTRSKIFEVYYFRMWLSLVFLAAAHGLIFLPVLFAVLGPQGYSPDGFDSLIDDTEWATEAGGRYSSSLLSFENNDENESIN